MMFNQLQFTCGFSTGHVSSHKTIWNHNEYINLNKHARFLICSSFSLMISVLAHKINELLEINGSNSIANWKYKLVKILNQNHKWSNNKF